MQFFADPERDPQLENSPHPSLRDPRDRLIRALGGGGGGGSYQASKRNLKVFSSFIGFSIGRKDPDKQLLFPNDWLRPPIFWGRGVHGSSLFGFVVLG